VAGLSLLNASSTTIDDLVQILSQKFPEVKRIPLKGAAAALKGSDNVLPQEPPSGPSMQVKADEALKMMRPIAQWEDRMLLETFAKTRDSELEQELDRRAQRNKFVVLKPGKYEPGKEEINLETSLQLLKTARKRTTPGTIPNGDIFSTVYRITELDPTDRIIELCPICGETLYQGYCEKCQSSFLGVDDDSRSYVKLIVGSSNFNPKSFSDRKAVIVSARKGIEDLKHSWPSLAQAFDEAKLTNSLPKLRVITNRPSTVADPFHVDGNRSFGNRTV